MISIYDAANWFIKKEPMTEIKCQILCYYAQAWSLAIDDKKMFNANRLNLHRWSTKIQQEKYLHNLR